MASETVEGSIVPGLDHVDLPQSDVEVVDYHTKYP